MKIFYTGAEKFENAQPTASNSLGNYISSTEVPNGLLSNVFDTISLYTIKLNKKEIRVLAIKNDSGLTLTGLKAHFEYPNTDDSTPADTNIAYFKIGYALAKADACGDLYADKVGSPYAIPYGITFQEADGIANALSLPNLAVNDYLIIYLQRILDPITQTGLTDEELVDLAKGVTKLELEETAGLVFSWN